MKIEIINSTGTEWYKDCIGKTFEFHSESRKGGKGKYIVKINKEDRHLMNGYHYGWIDKDHCKNITIEELQEKLKNNIDKAIAFAEKNTKRNSEGLAVWQED